MNDVPTFIVAALAVVVSLYSHWQNRRKIGAEADATTAKSALDIAQHSRDDVLRLEAKIVTLEEKLELMRQERERLAQQVGRLKRLLRQSLRQSRDFKTEIDDIALMAADAMFELAALGHRTPKKLPERVARLMLARARNEGVEALFHSRQEDIDDDDVG